MLPNVIAQIPTIGILYPGEMGSTLGKALAEDGLRVITTLEGRSPRTCRLCQEAGLEVVSGLREVVEAAHVIIALVPPALAIPVAERFVACTASIARRPLYVDANSISPGAAQQIAALLSRSGIDFVDGAIHGLASGLRSRGTFYLSGPSARQLAERLGRSVRIKVLGETPGRASAFKMMIAGLAKGLVALFLEMGLFAREAGLLDELLACYRESYPGIMTVVERMLPTYPQHAGRRGDEMREVERAMRSLGLHPSLVRGTRHLTEAVGNLNLAAQRTGAESPAWTLGEVLEAIYAHNPLRLPPND